MNAQVDARNRETSAREVKRFKAGTARGPYVAYLSKDRKRITTWTGDTLAEVTSITRERAPLHWWLTNERGLFTARGIDGRTWRGWHRGSGMHCKMRVQS